MSEPPLDLVQQFENKINELGKREALVWLETKISDFGTLAAAKLWCDQFEQPWAKDAFRGAVNSLLGNTKQQQVAVAKADVNEVLDAILTNQNVPSSLNKTTLKDYLRDLRRSMERVNSLGLKANIDSSPPRLEKVYVERSFSVHEWGMIMASFEGKEPWEQSLFDAIIQRPQSVITAGPGIGKTFLFRHLCLLFTDLNFQVDRRKKFEPSVPFLISLRKFAPWLRVWRTQNDASLTDDPPEYLRALWDFLETEWNEKYPGLAKGIREWLDAESNAVQRITFLFDGLDEVPIDRKDREWVSLMLIDLERSYPQLRIHTTCRVKSYGTGERNWSILRHYEDPPDSGEQDERLWPIVEIQPFNPEEIERFIQGWFDELARNQWFDVDRAGELASTFSEALGNRPDLQTLAPSPLMLTLMCIIHGTKRELPSGRGGLYHQLIGLMLGEWEKERKESAKGGVDRFADLCQRKSDISGGKPLETKDFLRKLGELVFELTESFAGEKRASRDEKKESGTGIIVPETNLEELLFDLCLGGRAVEEFAEEQISEARKWQTDMLAFIKDHGGLLDQTEGAGSGFAFPHRQYGEFLAGWYLIHHHRNKYERLTTLCRDFESWNDVWREPVLFGISWLATQDGGETVSRFVRELTGIDVNTAPPINLYIAGELLAEFGDPDYFHGNCDVWKDVEQGLLRRMLAKTTKSKDAIQERIRFGISLGLMGDPRPGIDVDSQTGLPDFKWSEKLMPPEVGFLMGSKTDDPEAYDDEKPQFLCTDVTVPYRMAIHPVTVNQYLPFVKAGGYHPDNVDRWWTTEGMAWKEKKHVLQPAFLSNGIEQATGNLPVTGVTFYETVAYCRWLREAGSDDEYLKYVRLPTEMEWEFAARDINGRLFPWGNEEDDLLNRCHFGETGLQHPSPVGIYSAQGRAVDSQVEDLAGNVWEWTQSDWVDTLENYTPSSNENGNHSKTLRGGAFYNNARIMRSAGRDRLNPDYRYAGIGFRVVSSPFETPQT